MPVPNWFGLFYRSSVATSRSKSAIFSSWLVATLLAGSVLVVVNTQQSVVLARRQHQQPGNRRSDSEFRHHLLLLLCHICALLLNACGKPSFRYRGCPLRPF